MNRLRVTIVQPYLPHYRIEFFQRLSADLWDRGIELVVAHGDPHGDQAVRADKTSLEGAVHLRQHTVRLGSRTLVCRSLDGLAQRSDALVLEQALHNLESYPLLFSPRRSRPVAMWGHTYTCLRTGSRPQKAATAAVTRRARWFFAYTPTGAAHLASVGFPSERITTVYNSVDTLALKAARQKVGEEGVRAFRDRYRLAAGRTAVYLGGLDTPKRTAFLLSAAALVAQRLPGFRLLVAGDGAQRHLVEEAAVRNEEIVYLGNVFRDHERALIGAAGDVMMAPGAVGLCAVVSFAIKTPIITVPWPSHGPEFEYLQHGRNALFSSNDVDSFAQTVAETLCDTELLNRLTKGCEEDAEIYTLANSTARFANGVEQMLASDGRHP